MLASGNWSAQQLAEFLAGLSAAESEEEATRRAVERAAEALEAEVGALVHAGRVDAAIGFPPGRVPSAKIVAIVESGATSIDLEGIGSCDAIAVPLEGDLEGHFVLARSGREFGAQETNLLRAMGRVLGLSVVRLRTLAAERERRTLLDRLSHLQRSISHHAPLQEVLDAISAGAGDLLSEPISAVVLLDPNNPEQMLTRATTGIGDDEFEGVRRIPMDTSVAGLAIREDRLVVEEDFQSRPDASADPVRARAQAVIAVPVREDQEMVGALVVVSEREGRRFSPAEREALMAFAIHASLALTDARLSDQVDRALHDTLTGLPNRAFLRDRLEQRLKASESQEQVAVLVVDLDAFRAINDRLGPAAGDGLLIEVAARLRSVAGPGDLVSNLGGDEFAIMAADADGAAKIGESVLECLAEPFGLKGRPVSITASVGLALDDRSPDKVLRNADLAMSQAKKAGGRCCVEYEPRMHSELVERLRLEDELARALEHDELEAHFQPKVDLATRRVVGFEALVRWRHPERGLLGPGEFLDAAEASGQMPALTARVLDQALDLAGGWWRRGRRLDVSVNLSPSTFNDPESDFYSSVAPALARHGLTGRALQFEVTEDTVMNDRRAAERLAQLSNLGVGLSIDDFGTGYSSLSRLKTLPIDELKIDRSFVMDLTSDGDDLAIVRATIELAHAMGLRVVAEGIETDFAWQSLLEMGCERAQGFLIAKPLSVDQLQPWFERWERARDWPRSRIGKIPKVSESSGAAVTPLAAA